MLGRPRIHGRRGARRGGALLCALALLAPGCATGARLGSVTGVLTNSVTGAPIIEARVLLRCDCLERPITRTTDIEGAYEVIEALPRGRYEIHSYAGKSHVTKIVTLPRGASIRANFSLDPGRDMELLEEVKLNVAPALG